MTSPKKTRRSVFRWQTTALTLLAGSWLLSGICIARPNVLFLLSDDQRPGTIAAHGNAVIQTPNLDRLARRGVSFTRATCANPICTPSRAEILTGCSGFRNGVLDFGGKIDPALPRWPDTMRQAGYETWYVGKWHNNGRPLDHGFTATQGLYSGGGGKWWVDQTDWKGFPITGYRGWVFQTNAGEKFPDRGVGLTGDISEKFADAAIEVIRRRREKPFFLQVNFTAPHDPLIMPPGFEDRYRLEDIPLPKNYLAQHPFDHGNLKGRDERLMPFPRPKKMVRDVLRMYYAVISHLDREVGRILAALEESGQAENTIVIFSSDHGLGVGSHGIRGKQNMYEHTIGVPLIISGPGMPRQQRRDAQCYLRDLFPTTCELAGIEIPREVEGRSLAGVIAGREQAVYDYIFGYFRDKQRMVRGDRWKLIHYPQVKRYQLFDLQADLDELHDLSADPAHRDVLNTWKTRLAELQ